MNIYTITPTELKHILGVHYNPKITEVAVVGENIQISYTEDIKPKEVIKTEIYDYLRKCGSSLQELHDVTGDLKSSYWWQNILDYNNTQKYARFYYNDRFVLDLKFSRSSPTSINIYFDIISNAIEYGFDKGYHSELIGTITDIQKMVIPTLFPEDAGSEVVYHSATLTSFI